MNKISLKLKNFLGKLKVVFAHFPLACMFALAFSVLFAYWLVNETCVYPPLTLKTTFYTWLWGCGIAMILTFSADMFCYLRENHRWKRILWNTLAIAIAAVSSWIIYRQSQNDFIAYYVCAMLFATILTILAWPMLGQRRPNMLWNYHTRLFVTLAISYFLSMIAFGGISLVLASIQSLFVIEMEKAIWVTFAVCSAFVIPYCTMALMPISKEEYDQPTAYSKWGKILVLYILLPIVCIDMLVLYVYALKILFAWQLPNGGVTYWVLQYAVIGSLICYLLMPVFCAEQPSKLRFFKQGFFISLLPLLILLFVGLYRRVHEYGFTTNRYLVLLAACWFTVVAVIQIVRKSRNVNPLLISLWIISLLLLVGPWNMMILPKQAQLHRFERIATECHLIENGMIVPATDTLTWEQEQAISSSLDFFCNNKTYMRDFTQRFCDMTIVESDSLYENYGLNEIKMRLAQKMNITYRNKWDKRNKSEIQNAQKKYFYFNRRENTDDMLCIAGYDYEFYTYLNFYQREKTNLSYKNSLQISLWIDAQQQEMLHVSVNDHPFAVNVVDSLQLSYYLKGDEHYIYLSPTSIFHEDEQIKFRMDVKQLDFEKDSTGNYALSYFDFTGLVKLK